MDELWRFSLISWRVPGVEASCLRLQDNHAVQVPLLLACAWMAVRGVPPDKKLLIAMRQCVVPWEMRLRALRDLRREAASQSAWQEWKRLLGDAELEAERLVLAELEQLLQAYPRASESAAPVLEWLLVMCADSPQTDELVAELAQLSSLLSDRWRPSA